MAKPLQLVFRQTGHFHNRLVINTAIAHRFGNLHRSLVFPFFYALLYSFLMPFSIPSASHVPASVISNHLHAAARA
ncbi:hypothetical protein MJ390_01615 [Klebsiella pneumoniae]|nr:hypothetical protein MJ390_01615 [Klebsiella pneumoniae]